MGNFLSSKRDFQRSIGILIFEQSHPPQKIKHPPETMGMGFLGIVHKSSTNHPVGGYWGWDLGDEVNPSPILGGWDDFFPHVGRWRGAVGAH
jgi:hypothetical protein